MSNNIKKEVDKITIPEQLEKNREKGIHQAAEAQVHRKQTSFQKWMVASVLIVLLGSAFMYHSEVIAAVQKALQYVPGIGVVEEEESEGERYVLEETKEVEVDGGTVTITNVVVDSEQIYAVLSGEGTPQYLEMTLVNDSGKKYTFNSSYWSSSSNQWTSNFYEKGEFNLSGQVEVVLRDKTIPITLVETKSYETFRDMGITDTQNGITIAAIPSRDGDKGRISLVSQHSEDFTIKEYGLHEVPEDKKIHVQDNEQKQYELSRYKGISRASNELYFELPTEEKEYYTLRIPVVNVEYKDEVEITLPLPKDEEKIDESFKLAGYPVDITGLERTDDDRLRINVDVHYEENDSRSLHMFRIKEKSHMAKFNPKTNVIQYLEFDVDWDQEKVNVKFDEPEVFMRGPWEFGDEGTGSSSLRFPE
ncbi:DUF4179 domain-containing protein [Pontibacillus yanchengensis]|uniref:DUF4179 domain-containing protein n=1 Tax=Pontibacillus yanchengensis Y32 TaxID=1385514 RepID=A0A0A2TJA3_9BACI|nr:DUF4179 domain-containing protein [Pontibacillus yanchengensis]KGP74513.1 hypothetical protein N782_12500 [Pontibacillus yanchengensis Y32]